MTVAMIVKYVQVVRILMQAQVYVYSAPVVNSSMTKVKRKLVIKLHRHVKHVGLENIVMQAH